MAPKDRLWDFARMFTVKSGAKFDALATFFAHATPRQIELLGFPPVDAPLWTDDFLTGMRSRWPGFDPTPYLEARA
jgi:hypothetical protein